MLRGQSFRPEPIETVSSLPNEPERDLALSDVLRALQEGHGVAPFAHGASMKRRRVGHRPATFSVGVPD